jgi:hypothetical protein
VFDVYVDFGHIEPTVFAKTIRYIFFEFIIAYNHVAPCDPSDPMDPKTALPQQASRIRLLHRLILFAP